jgi:hypothetical protein
MGLLSSSISITRYKVEGRLSEPLLDEIRKGLQKNIVSDIDKEPVEIKLGWTPLDHPFEPDFDRSDLVIGTDLFFSLRIDKKNIPAKTVNKYVAIETAKRLTESGREYISKNEKKMIKERVLHSLYLRIPATPNIYDILWKYEAGDLYFFSNLKSANEAFESLFFESFKLTVYRMFPFTHADLAADLSSRERDLLLTLSPTSFI